MDVEFAQERKEIGFWVAGGGVIVALVDGGEDRRGGGLDGVDFLDVVGEVV